MAIVEGQALHSRQRVDVLDLGQLAGSIGGPPGAVDLLRGRHEPLSSVEPHTNGRDSIAAQDIQSVDVLARRARESDSNIDALMMGKGESAGRLLARLEPAV